MRGGGLCSYLTIKNSGAEADINIPVVQVKNSYTYRVVRIDCDRLYLRWFLLISPNFQPNLENMCFVCSDGMLRIVGDEENKHHDKM